MFMTGLVTFVWKQSTAHSASVDLLLINPLQAFPDIIMPTFDDIKYLWTQPSIFRSGSSLPVSVEIDTVCLLLLRLLPDVPTNSKAQTTMNEAGGEPGLPGMQCTEKGLEDTTFVFITTLFPCSSAPQEPY